MYQPTTSSWSKIAILQSSLHAKLCSSSAGILTETLESSSSLSTDRLVVSVCQTSNQDMSTENNHRAIIKTYQYWCWSSLLSNLRLLSTKYCNLLLNTALGPLNLATSLKWMGLRICQLELQLHILVWWANLFRGHWVEYSYNCDPLKTKLVIENYCGVFSMWGRP